MAVKAKAEITISDILDGTDGTDGYSIIPMDRTPYNTAYEYSWWKKVSAPGYTEKWAAVNYADFKIGDIAIFSGTILDRNNAGVQMLLRVIDVGMNGEHVIRGSSICLLESGEDVQAALSNMIVGSRNLFADTGREISNNGYIFAQYVPASDPLIPGEVYTATICVTPAPGVTQFRLHFSYGYDGAVASFIINGQERQIISKTFTMRYSSGYTPDDDIKNSYAMYYRLPNDNTVTENSTMHWVKIEKGNKATDWTPAPEDVQEGIDNAQDTADKAEGDASNALNQVVDAKATLSLLQSSIETLVTDANGASMMTQTSTGWTFNMGGFESALDKATNDITAIYGDISAVTDIANAADQLAKDIANKTAYINMSTDEDGAPCIELGKTDNEFKLRITNTSIDFMQGSQKIAYITNQSLYIRSSVVTDEMQIGEGTGFIWKKRSNGNMGLRSIG